MRTTPFVAAALAVLALAPAACKGREAAPPPPPPAAPRPRIIKDVPIAGVVEFGDTTGTPDAERLTMRVNLPGDSVIAFYRAQLPPLGWDVVGDHADVQTGTLDLYAKKGAQNLWVHVERKSPTSAEYTLLGSARETDMGRLKPRTTRP